MNSSLLNMQYISIRYPGKSPFEKILFQLQEGDHVALVGENFAIINALMDAIAGRAIVSKGKIEYDFMQRIKIDESEPLHSLSPYHYIGYLSSAHHFKSLSGVNESYYQQRYNAQDSENSLTVKRYLSGIRSTTGNQSWNFDKVVEKLHLEKLLKEHVIKLSNGETKRVRLAAAILQNPVILLLDHPFTGIDVGYRKEMHQLINEISQSGIALIISTSEAEIPECITHVTLFEKDDSLRHFTKKDFHEFHIPSRRKIDQELLASLLKNEKTGQFDLIVQMENVTVRYDENLILNDINWTVKQGERWSLSGPNGAGKTTLLSLINADNPQAFANNIILFDRKKGSGESIWDIKRNIGFFSPELFQFFPLNTTCLAAVESGFFDTMGLFRKVSLSMKTTAMNWLKLMEIDHLAHKPLRTITPGEKRLCLLARALVKNAPLLILDEPCQGLNESEKLFIKEIIDSICLQTNLTLIYVSHYRQEIPESVTQFFELRKP